MNTETSISSSDSSGTFTDFKGLHARLHFYSARSLRELVRRGAIPSIILPGGRKRLFHLPSVDAALLRHQS